MATSNRPTFKDFFREIYVENVRAKDTVLEDFIYKEKYIGVSSDDIDAIKKYAETLAYAEDTSAVVEEQALACLNIIEKVEAHG